MRPIPGKRNAARLRQKPPDPIRGEHPICFDCIRNQHAKCKGNCSCICWRDVGLVVYFHAGPTEKK